MCRSVAGDGVDYHDWVLDVGVDVARSMLGRLPGSKARNVAYGTAEDLFDVDVEAA